MKMFFKRIFQTVKAQEDDLVDPQQVLKDKCRETPHCQAFLNKYNECSERVLSRSQTTETCMEELFDMLHCVDHCVTPKLFKQLNPEEGSKYRDRNVDDIVKLYFKENQL